LTNKIKIFAPDFILIGDSHNFGQALDFDLTFQSLLSKIGKTINLSVPGYGLNNSIASLIELKNSNLLKPCKNNYKNTKFIYRMIDDHVNRNTGKTSFNPFGPKIDGPNNHINAYCNSLIGCAHYLWNYLPATLVNRLLGSNEILSRNLGSLLHKNVYYQKSDYEYTIFLTDILNSIVKNYYPSSELFIIVEDGDYNSEKRLFKKNENLDSFLNDQRIVNMINSNLIIKMSNIVNEDSYLTEDCKKSNTLYIPYEGHPNHCNNLLWFSYLKKYF
jgi:hypothetical protein